MYEIKVELFIPGELKDKPIICDIIRNFKIDMKIMEASFSTESGWAYLIIKGEKNEVERLLAYLDQENIKVDSKS